MEEEEEEKESSEDAEIASEKWLGMEVATITSDIAEKISDFNKNRCDNNKCERR